MHELLNGYISTYGYLAIFCLVLMQESGIPGLPNEFVLFYFGYISHRFHLSYIIVLAVVIIADTMGSFILYLLFYHGSNWLMQHKPKWLRIPVNKILALKKRITESNGRTILIGKLTPFIRGYIPVAAGMLQVDPVIYGRIILFTALIWSGGWITAGWLFFGR